MNLYFLLEGKRTEAEVYPSWISHLLPSIKQVERFDQVDSSNYFLLSASGYPSIIEEFLPAAINDINSIDKYTHLVICLDAEEGTVNGRRSEIHAFLSKHKIQLTNCSLIIIVQNRCIETWMLGNKKIYSRSPQSKLLSKYNKHYNVSTDDPELMGNYSGFKTHAQFHLAYLKEMFKEKKRSYSKSNVKDVCTKSYLNQLVRRIDQDQNHLNSFREFIHFCDSLQNISK